MLFGSKRRNHLDEGQCQDNGGCEKWPALLSGMNRLHELLDLGSVIMGLMILAFRSDIGFNLVSGCLAQNGSGSFSNNGFFRSTICGLRANLGSEHSDLHNPTEHVAQVVIPFAGHLYVFRSSIRGRVGVGVGVGVRGRLKWRYAFSRPS